MSPRQETSAVVIGGREYHTQFILPAMNEGRKTTRIYRIDELFAKETALVMITKKINRNGASERLNKEASYATKVSVSCQ